MHRRSFLSLAPFGLALPLIAREETPAAPQSDPTEPTLIHVDGLDPMNPRHQHAFMQMLNELRSRGFV